MLTLLASRHGDRHGFTLIELLVVITIIVVLLALLAPALDKAIYQAELAVCGTNLKGIATGVTVSAMDHGRRYPYRRVVHETLTPPMGLVKGGGAGGTGVDDRPMLKPYVQLPLFGCPLSGRVDYESPNSETWVFASYNLWFGWQYVGEAGMNRIGDRFIWSEGTGEDTVVKRFDVLAGDMDVQNVSNGNQFGSHPDNDGLLHNERWQNDAQGTLVPGNPGTGQNYVFARWENVGRAKRGLLDLNMVATDNSVARYAGVRQADDPPTSDYPFVAVSEWNSKGNPTQKTYVPKGQ